LSYAPALEWRQVARWAGYTFEAFQALDGEQQAAHVAAYRTVNTIDAVLTLDAQKRAERRRKAESAGARTKSNGR
jgi:hypothetical protein